MAKADEAFVRASLAANSAMASDELAACFEGWTAGEIAALRDGTYVAPTEPVVEAEPKPDN